MLESELIDLIKIETTGRLVEFELEDAVVSTIIKNALNRISDWFVEAVRFETIGLKSGGDGFFFLESDLTKTPWYIHDIWETGQGDSDTSYISLVSNLLGLPGGLFYFAGTGYEFGDGETPASVPGQYVFDDWFITYAHYTSVRPALDQLAPSLDWAWDHPLKKIHITGVQGPITVIYSPLAVALNEVTYGPAIDWITDYSIAKTKIALGRARGKFRGGGLNFDTDAAELIGEGNEAVRALDEAIYNLHFVCAVER